MHQDRFLQLLSRKLANEATIQELDELHSILDASPHCKALYDNLQQQHNGEDFVTKYRANRAYELLATKLSNVSESEVAADTFESDPPVIGAKQSSYKKYFLVCTSVAATLIVAFFSFFHLYQSNLGKDVAAPHNEIVTSKGQKSKIVLPDGTQVWLNADSKIIYPENFQGDTREIQLEGEAFFDVTHNKRKPFIIHTKEMNIKVLGTAFNVKAYPKDDVSEAALIRGSIEVSFPNRPNQNLILKPNEKIEFKNVLPITKVNIVKQEVNSGATIAVNPISFTKTDSVVIETAWKNGKLIFNAKSFLLLSQDLERWYDVKIIIDNEKLKTKMFTASFNNETIDDVLQYLKLSYHFNYNYNKELKEIRIH